MVKYFVLVTLLISTYANAEVVVIPSDYSDYSYTDTEHFKNTGQMKDETYSDFIHREVYMEEDMELDGYFVDEYERD